MKNEKFVEDDPRAIKVIRTGPEKMDKSSTSEHYKCKTGEVIEGRNFCSGSPEEKLYNIVKNGRAAGDSLEKMISDAESDKDITGKYKSVVVAVMEENGKQNDPGGSEAKKMAENRKRAEEEEAAKNSIPETAAQKQARAEKEYYEAKHQRTLDENRAKVVKKFGEDAVNVVDDYTNQDYSIINRYLRSGEVRDEDLSRVKHEVEVLDKLTSKGFDTSVLGVQSTWPKPISSLYRGLSDDNLFEQLKSHYGEEAFKLAADKYDNSGFEKVIQEKGPYIYEDKAFMSTSSSLVAPEVYMNAEKPAESNFAFSIEVPHGVKMPGYETISYRDRDAEVILPRGTKLELVSVSKVRSYIDENFNYYKVNARISGLKTKKIPGKQTSEHYKCPTNTVKPGSCECPKDAEDVQLKARKAKDTGIQVRMVAENSYKPARTYTLNNISIDEFTMDESKQRYPIKDISKVVTSMPDKISSTIKKIEVHEGPSPMTEEISKKLGVQATIEADAEYTTGKIRIWNGSLDSGDDVDGMKLLQENLPHEAAHLVDRMTLSQSPDYAAAVESDGGWATGYAKDTAELDLKAGYGEDFADSVSEWVTARRSKADMGSHRLANRFKYFEEVLGQ